ncbi:facilitated trehalose transporter Tret1-like [Artemia franciscana]|uniref:Major facilitator superfamily (MFS) profile domain-containing protein n=1 Tax=Artemia franciscana TaxID=6661 RepID=A0AA88L5X2_ARTSF|nr:hypothetical protein QYM36_006779 [Artemia franciscana]
MLTKPFYLQLGVTIAASFSFLSFGAVRSWSSPAVPSLLSNNVINQSEVAMISSLSPLGAIPGALLAGPCMDKFGRRSTLLGISLPWVATFVILSFAETVEIFYVTRLLLGLFMGIATPVAQIYISECVDAKLRSAFGSITSLAHAVGILSCYILGSFLPWDQLSMVLGVFPALLFVGMFFAPPSPTWLISRSRISDAKKHLKALTGKDPNEVNLENLLPTNQDNSIGAEHKLLQIIQKPNLKILGISVVTMIFQQFSGINSIIFHTVLIFDLTDAGVSSKISTIIVGITLLVFTVVATIVVGRYGRRILLMTSGFIMFLSTLFLSLFFYFKEWIVSDFGFLPVLCLIIYIAAFSVGYNNVPFLLMGELFPKNIKNIYSSFSMMMHISCSFLIVYSFPVLIQVVGPSVLFLMYAVVNLIGVPIIYFILPETKGKTLDEIENMFRNRRGESSTYV